MTCEKDTIEYVSAKLTLEKIEINITAANFIFCNPDIFVLSVRAFVSKIDKKLPPLGAKLNPYDLDLYSPAGASIKNLKGL